MWRDLPREVVNAWKERAQWLNARPRRFIVNRIPTALSVYPEANILINECVTEDMGKLSRVFISSLKNGPARHLCDVHKYMPLKVKIRKQVFRMTTSSALLKKTFFGTQYECIYDIEVVSGDGCDPYFFHIASKKRLLEIFSIEDSTNQVCQLTKNVDPKSGHKQWLTSRGLLRNSSNQGIRCFGWDEDDSSITWIYNNDSSSDTPFQSVTLPRPMVLRSESTNRIQSYVLNPTFIDGWRLAEYYPVSIYVSDI